MKFYSLILFIFLFTSCNSLNRVLKSKDSDYKYKKATQFFQEKKYNYVIQIFDDNFFRSLKGTKDFEEAFYMLAYSHFYEKDYFNAENLFNQFAETFANTPRGVEMEFMKAFTVYKQSPKVDLEQTNSYKTISMMNQFINKNPTSVKVAEAEKIILECQAKIESKDFKAAKLYYDMGQYKAASVAYGNMLTLFPESDRTDLYKFMSVKSYYEYAMLSIQEKKLERLETVLNECNDFVDRFPDSKYKKDIDKLISNSNLTLKNKKNEQTSQTTGS